MSDIQARECCGTRVNEYHAPDCLGAERDPEPIRDQVVCDRCRVKQDITWSSPIHVAAFVRGHQDHNFAGLRIESGRGHVAMRRSNRYRCQGRDGDQP